MAYLEWKNETYEIDGLGKAINEALSKYGDFALDVIAETLDEMKKEIPKRLKVVSPRREGAGKHYANGWKAKSSAHRMQISLVVYNDVKPQLTHLLEDGYTKRNGDYYNGKPHIAPVNEWAQEETIRRVEEKLNDI